ncbi:MAG TPA: cupin domain-containing protein [Solirubrobacteraceae bacterium]|nr:cupin domain-containing protein [Solirubrobacteraceae bacterium]
MPARAADLQHVGGLRENGLHDHVGARARRRDSALDPTRGVSVIAVAGQHRAKPLVQSLATAPGDSLLGGSIRIRVRSEDSGGGFGLVEQIVPGGYPGPALHLHPEFEETFYVIEGRIAVRVGDEAHEAGPGTVAVIPRGTPHTFANPFSAPARMLVLVTPGGFERYFAALIGALREAGGFPPPPELAALGIAHGSVPA